MYHESSALNKSDSCAEDRLKKEQLNMIKLIRRQWSRSEAMRKEEEKINSTITCLCLLALSPSTQPSSKHSRAKSPYVKNLLNKQTKRYSIVL